jgi:hypothetical protein
MNHLQFSAESFLVDSQNLLDELPGRGLNGHFTLIGFA